MLLQYTVVLTLLRIDNAELSVVLRWCVLQLHLEQTKGNHIAQYRLQFFSGN